jgi:3-phosphoshikimate 1-carboxyvinyltransferase
MKKPTQLTVQPGGSLQGTLRVPGDKSISHRAIMLSAIAQGTSQIIGLLESDDTIVTASAFRAMGVTIEKPQPDHIIIHGVGLHGLRPPIAPLYLGNSGTSMRLLAGLMAGQAFSVEMQGDNSLSRRPMRRVTVPLSLMGAEIETSPQGTPPLMIEGGYSLHGIKYFMPIASAQIKSSLLLAGLYAQDITTVIEPAPCRDHTERMLQAFGHPITRKGAEISLPGKHQLQAATIEIPADISSAAFFIVGATIAANSQILLTHVGVNPTRIGIINILRQMGADIELQNQRTMGGEPVADIQVRTSQLHGIKIPPEQVPLAIDEFPIILIAAACAQGETILTDAEELKVKESDRIHAMAEGLQTVGIQAEPTNDGIIIQGGQIQGGIINSHGDHRIAMAFAIAALRAQEKIIITDCANVATSYPNFVEQAKTAGIQLTPTG